MTEVVRRRPRSLAHDLVDALAGRIRAGNLSPGEKLPTEAAIMEDFGVSRTVVREAISRLQAGGLVETRHGVGTFVVARGEGGAFRIGPEQLETLQDVIAVLELRIAVETESAAPRKTWRRCAMHSRRSRAPSRKGATPSARTSSSISRWPVPRTTTTSST
jgi:GntR family transcriptional regulator, transcriptional repressor for pyruvate dehydrogenase complex